MEVKNSIIYATEMKWTGNSGSWSLSSWALHVPDYSCPESPSHELLQHLTLGLLSSLLAAVQRDSHQLPSSHLLYYYFNRTIIILMGQCTHKEQGVEEKMTSG